MTPRGAGQGGGEGDAGGTSSSTPPLERDLKTEAAARAVEEAETLRAQLGAAHAASTRLQEELRASEGELQELHDGYALLWDELQQQRAAMLAATTRCTTLQEQVDGYASRMGTPRRSSPGLPTPLTANAT